MKNPEKYYAALRKHNAFVIAEKVNSIGQQFQVLEHPTKGDEAPVIVMFPRHEVAFDSDFFEADDLIAGEDYEPHFVDGKLLHRYELSW